MRYVPYSNRRYYVSQFVIFETRTNLPIPVENGMVELEWINGRDSYELGLILLMAIKEPNINPDFIMDCKFLKPFNRSDDGFVEDDLGYAFRHPVPMVGYDGFFIIPGFSSYAISMDGRVINTQTKQFKLFSRLQPTLNGRRKSGYYYVGLVDDYGKTIKAYRHRLLCLTFKTLTHGYAKMVSNHLDGVPGNDVLENLELTTQTNNLQHSWDNNLRETKPVEMRNLNSSEYIVFNTIASAERVTGITRSEIRTRLKYPDDTYWQDGVQFRYKKDTPWPEPKYGEVRKPGVGVDTVAYDVLNNKLLIFPSIVSMAKTLGMDQQAATAYIWGNRKTPYKGYVIAYKDNFEIPIYSDAKKRVFKTNGCRDGKMCYVHDVDGNLVYEGLVSGFAKSSGIARELIYGYLRTGNMTQHKLRFTVLE